MTDKDLKQTVQNAPDRRCLATATFIGAAQSRLIEGTFTSICEDGVRQLRGRWRVTRQPAASR